MESTDAIELIEPIPWGPELDQEWERQIHGTASAALARQSIGSTAPAKGKTLWLVVRRALSMVIAAFDDYYGIETKKR